jgi:hypothetical protein
VKEFNTHEEVMKYLDDMFIKGKDYSYTQLACIAYPMFVSPLMTDVTFLLKVSKRFEFVTGKDLARVVAREVDLSGDTLTLSQFYLLCSIRGPATLENFEFEVVKKLDQPVVQAFAKHKDFPLHLKTEFYNRTGEVEYLPQDAQDIFIF